MEIITTHKSADFDALASVVAAALIYPFAQKVLPKRVNPNVKAFLSIHKDLYSFYHPDEIDVDKVNRLVVVDTHSWDRIENLKKLKKKEDLEIILWDHHSGQGDIVTQHQVRECLGANITLMIRKLKEDGISLTPMLSTLFLAGVYEDTGNLTFSSTTAEDAHAAAYLLEQKADLSVLRSFLRPAYSESQKNVLFQMLQNAKRKNINGYSVSINHQKIKGHVDNLSVVVHMYREILNADAAFGIFEISDNKGCIVIGRSHAESLNIGSIMRSLGGGGHPGAGSVMLKSANPDIVEEMIVELISGNQQASVQISDIMSFPVYTVPADITMQEVAHILRKKGCTGVPVIEDDKLVGIISRRDFKKVKKDSQLAAPVKAFMSRDVITIEPGKSPIQAARIMVKYDIGRLPVVEGDKIVGIITRSDSMMYFYDLMPD